MSREVFNDTLIEAGKAAPPVAVVANAAANGWTMTQTAAGLTVVYLVLQIVYLVWKWRNERQDRQARQQAGSTEGATCP